LVTITHPYHPLCGQQVEVIRVRHGADPDLVVQLPGGLHVAIAMNWTNYAIASDGPAPTVALHLLEINGLRQVAQLIEHIRQAAPLPTVQKLNPPT